MMPHPERALYSLQNPLWIDQKNKNKLFGDGYKIFKNAVDYFK